MKALLALILAQLLLLSGCGIALFGPARVPLPQLIARQEAYNGQQVATEGTVREFDDAGGRYYVVEDEQSDRVRIEPAAAAATYDGQDVTVFGRFRFSESSGRSIAAQRIEPANG